MRFAKLICPFCGYWVKTDRLKGHYPLKILQFVFGGRKPHSKEGIMHHIDITDQLKTVAEEMLLSRLKEIALQFGYKLTPIVSIYEPIKKFDYSKSNIPLTQVIQPRVEVMSYVKRN